MAYFCSLDNYIEWLVYMCAVFYVVPGERKGNLQIALGAISVFFAWINFSLFLKRFSLFGIYIIMAQKVFRTVCKVNVQLNSFYFSLEIPFLISNI